MTRPTLLWLSLAILAIGFAVNASARELGVHQHGHGTLNIAIDGKAMWIELEAPGADIVGFEHEPETAAEKSAVEKALTDLKNPFSSFTLAPEAGCSVEAATVELVGSDHHDEAGEKHGEEEALHSAFHAEYRLGCSKPELVDGMDFTYFDLFPRSQELMVNVIKESGQRSYEVERDAPRLRFEGL